MKILLKGGRVLDERNDLDGTYDIFIANGTIAKIGKNIKMDENVRIINCENYIIVPGLIDIHTHTYTEKTSLGINPDRIGLLAGINTIVDAGSSGADNFEDFKKRIIDNSRTSIYEFINLSKIGLTGGAGELASLDNIDLEKNTEIINKYKKIIKGIKVRASNSVVGELGLKPIKIGKDYSNKMGLPLMVHIGNSPPTIEEILNIVDKNDIITHIFHGKKGGILDKNLEIKQIVKDSYKKGVIFDIGHGAASFNFAVARKAIEEGLIPYTISSDIHARNIQEKVQSLALTMSKVLACGMTLEKVLYSVTTHPANILDIDNEIREANKADLSILTLEDANYQVKDSQNNSTVLKKIFTIKYAIKNNHLVEIEDR